ncbi:MAG: polysaccharide deacetylase family protein [Candidatus Acidiferrum sp.]
MPVEIPTTDASPPQRSGIGEETNSRPRWRDAVAASLFHTGALRVLQAVTRGYEFKASNSRGLLPSRRTGHPKFLVLCYHRIGTSGIPLFSELLPSIFEAQMQYIRRRYRILSLDEMCDEMEKPSCKEDAITVTFDDGYRDLHTHALPVLRKYQIPATIFLPVASIESGQVPWYDRIFLALQVFPKDEFEITLDRCRNFQLTSFHTRLEAAAEINQYLRTLPDDRRKEYCAALEVQIILPEDELRDRMLTWKQIRSMSRERITFGSHTMTHPAVSQLTESELDSELGESKRALERRIGGPAVHFAYPFGKPADCGRAALPFLVRNGYRSAAMTVEGINEPGDNRFELRRSQVGNERSLPMFAFKLNQLFLSSGAQDSPVIYTGVVPVLGEPLTKTEGQRPRANNA